MCCLGGKNYCLLYGVLCVFDFPVVGSRIGASSRTLELRASEEGEGVLPCLNESGRDEMCRSSAESSNSLGTLCLPAVVVFTLLMGFRVELFRKEGRGEGNCRGEN
jgi:hypothetical protein